MIEDRGFKKNAPRNTEERIEAIYEELAETVDVHQSEHLYWKYKQDEHKERVKLVTLKDYVIGLLDWAERRDKGRADEKSAEIQSENVAVGLLAFLAFLGLALNSLSNKNFGPMNDYIGVCRITGWMFALIYLGVYIERASFFRHIWKYGSTKFVFGILFSGLVIYSYGIGSSQINSIFGVDASNLPYTRIFAMGIFTFKSISLGLIIVGGIVATVHMGKLVRFAYLHKIGKYELFPGASIGIAVVTLLFSWWTFHLETRVSREELSLTLYKLSHVLDFNAKHSCRNLPQDISVIFIGADQKRVLVDSSEVDVGTINEFLYGSRWSEVEIPSKFQQPPCETDESYDDKAASKSNDSFQWEEVLGGDFLE